MNRPLALTLFALITLTAPIFAQSLDDVIDQSSHKPGVYSPPNQSPQTGDTPITTDDPLYTRDFITDFPRGFPTLDRFVGFLDSLIKKILEKFREQKKDQETPTQPYPPLAADEPAPGKDNDDIPVPGPATGGGKTTLPSEPAVRETGSEFLTRTEPMNPAQREQEILKAILGGNMPDFLKTPKGVTVKMKLSDGKEHSVTYNVLPDYLAIGPDHDFVRIPMSPIAAQTIAVKFGCILPTTKMVDDIFKNAQTQMYPQPMSGGQYPNWQARMTKNEFYREHHRLVEGQRSKSGHQFGTLIAGHKKDVVISNFLNTHPKNVIIYGWHDKRNGGKPIQGYGWGHENTYADYSHGIRLINQTMWVDGREATAAEILGDPLLSRLLSNEGPVKDLRAIR